MRPSTRSPLLAVLVAIAAVLACAVPAQAQEPATLVIVETASVLATPDAAELQAVVQRRARTGAIARRRADRRVRALIAAVQQLGVPAENVRTNVFETYSDRERGRRVRVVNRGFEVRVTDLAKLEAVVAALGGAVQGGPDFIVSDPTEEHAAAAAIALQRARARADAAAAALGLRVLGIRKVDLSPEFGYDSDSFSAVSRGSDESESSGGAGTVEVETGQNRIDAAVAVIYEIGP
jgi:uncharacterized protein YggE